MASRCLGVVGPPHDLRAVGAVERAAVVAEPVGEARDVGAVRAHGVQIEVAVAHRGEDDAIARGREGGFGIVAERRGELQQIRSVGVRREDVEARVHGPYVPHGEVGRGGAGKVEVVRGRVEDPVAARVEIRARCAAVAGADPLPGAGGRIDRVDLVAPFAGGRRRLEDQRGAVKGPVAFGVLALEGELRDPAEAGFALLRQRRSGSA